MAMVPHARAAGQSRRTWTARFSSRARDPHAAGMPGWQPVLTPDEEL
ncbi:hypothetical protein SGL43_07321 [Streptomyces globisporus]|uniref:Uncharacterized protein n=1 Tax=Streptomyces globisporus TaxID=1908 RepID=A0ABN8VCQ4_STRGL|nr:hypothetical protein SGL43_07321 [Streptomyces globisporus]